MLCRHFNVLLSKTLYYFVSLLETHNFFIELRLSRYKGLLFEE